ncbi:antA/AntB antirepressor family protein [Aquitalea magnusonii]|uniref:Phage anti-repressor protein n=1 Tax=Aquitalea magnusonii TaxID=332411 RepID=A0A318JMH5_9NEIS|nr:antA/AntB antirepressor family protein [Aquitalea magnusonii]PXX49391.1 phage anti-repressor protein [Aquitalea magnusonii]
MANQIVPQAASAAPIRTFIANIGGDAVLACDARELHAFLGAKTRFNDWIADRIQQGEFVENQDFVNFTENSVKIGRGRPAVNYALSIDMAKHLGMMERNEQGKAIRAYFIRMEREAMRRAMAPVDGHAAPMSAATRTELASEFTRLLDCAKNMAVPDLELSFHIRYVQRFEVDHWHELSEAQARLVLAEIRVGFLADIASDLLQHAYDRCLMKRFEGLYPAVHSGIRPDGIPCGDYVIRVTRDKVLINYGQDF